MGAYSKLIHYLDEYFNDYYYAEDKVEEVFELFLTYTITDDDHIEETIKVKTDEGYYIVVGNPETLRDDMYRFFKRYMDSIKAYEVANKSVLRMVEDDNVVFTHTKPLDYDEFYKSLYNDLKYYSDVKDSDLDKVTKDVIDILVEGLGCEVKKNEA